MLIYVASYPRSGSALMEQTINTFFERPVSDIYPLNKPIERFFATAPYATNWRYNAQTASPKKYGWRLLDKLNERFFVKYDLDEWKALYDLNVSPYTKDCQCLIPGFEKALTPEKRQELANDKTYFFVKTHELPYSEYFANEYVIQMVRHPGHVLWSYFNLLKDFYQQGKTIEEVIEGNTQFGSWSQWYQTWNQVIPNFGDRFLRLRFEDVVTSDRRQTCDRIQSTISLEYKSDRQEPSFEQLHKKNPNYYRSGKVGNWQEHYTSEQINLIQKFHGATMEQFDYELN